MTPASSAKSKENRHWAGEDDTSSEASYRRKDGPESSAASGGNRRAGRHGFAGDGSGAKGGGSGFGRRRQRGGMSPPPGGARAGGGTVFPPSPNSALNKPDSFDYLTAEVRVMESRRSTTVSYIAFFVGNRCCCPDAHTGRAQHTLNAHKSTSLRLPPRASPSRKSGYVRTPIFTHPPQYLAAVVRSYERS